MLLVILKVKELLEHFINKLQKRNQKKIRVEKRKRKADKLYAKWNSCNSSCNSLIDA